MSGHFSKGMSEIIKTVNLLKSSFSKGADDISSEVKKSN